MSSSLYYQPVNPTYLTGGNSVGKDLEVVFGNLPRTFTIEDTDKLQAMSALWCNHHTEPTPDPYKILIHMIIEHGEVRVWFEDRG